MQATTNARLNLQENEQRKAILNSMQGTRVFRGSALSRAVVGNTPGTGGEQANPAPSRSQLSESMPVIGQGGITSLLDERAQNAASGNTAAGGAGASGGATAGRQGGYGGGSNARASVGNR